MKKPAQRMHLGLLMRLLTLPTLISHKNKLTKSGMEGIKPPYLLLCNHNAFMDFSVALKATRGHRVNFVVAIDGFLKREWRRALGGVTTPDCTFTSCTGCGICPTTRSHNVIWGERS